VIAWALAAAPAARSAVHPFHEPGHEPDGTDADARERGERQ